MSTSAKRPLTETETAERCIDLVLSVDPAQGNPLATAALLIAGEFGLIDAQGESVIARIGAAAQLLNEIEK